MLADLRETITNLIASNLATMVYYNHSDNVDYRYFHNGPLTELPDYDGGDDYYKDYEPCIEFAGSGDYVGSTIDMANRRYIEQEYPELIESGAIVYQKLSYGYTSMIIFFLRPSVARSGLIDDLEGLPDYCLLDDELDSVIQDELLEESWGNWLASDFESELENLTGFEFVETDWQASLFWELLRNGNGGEYYPETGENIYVDLKEVFKDSESLIKVIQDNADNLDTGEFEIESQWRKVGDKLGIDWGVYTGGHDHATRVQVIKTLEGYTPHMVKGSVLLEFGLVWREEQELFWEVKPTNAKLKDALKEGVTNILPIEHDEACYCENCHRHTVMFVHFGNPHNVLYVCADCYNKLMNYWPKCEHCQAKNANTTMQYGMFPDMDSVSSKTHCVDCKNLLLSNL